MREEKNKFGITLLGDEKEAKKGEKIRVSSNQSTGSIEPLWDKKLLLRRSRSKERVPVT